MLRDRTFSVHPKGGVPRSSEEVILRNGAESNTSGDSVIPAAVTREKNFRAWSAGVRVPMAEPRKKKQEKKKKKQQQQQKQPQLLITCSSDARLRLVWVLSGRISVTSHGGILRGRIT